jgi:hypothetical protein
MSDGTVDLINRTKAAMRQVETPLNKNGGEVHRSRSPNNTVGSVTKLPEDLGLHTPFRDRKK